MKAGLIKEIQWYHDVPEWLHLTLLNVPIAWSFLYFISDAQTEQSSPIFVSWHQDNIIFSSDLPKSPFCKFEWSQNPQKKKKKSSKTCHIFFIYPLTQWISLHNYEAHLWPRTGLQPSDCLSLILDSVIKLSNKGLVLLKYEKEMGTERKGNEKRETVKVY